MKIPTFSFLTFLTLLSCCIRAQNTEAAISGIVLDAGKKPVAGATVTLLTIKDSSEVKTIATDQDGNFSLTKLKADFYLVKITSVGYKKYSSAPIVVKKQPVRLPPIALLADNAILKEVDVTAKKSYIEQKIDRTVVNVGALISNTGTDALEVLEKAPGVVVDPNGNITFKGKSGVMVMIDGKPTYLAGANLVAYLRSLPSSSLDQIELMDSPPARYDAAGNAGVINIKLKKNTIRGFNAVLSSSFTQGFYARTNHSLNLNYRVNKLNLFANTSYNYSRTFRRLDIDRVYLNAAGELSSSFTDSSYFRPFSHSFNLRAGGDYYLSPKTTWGIVFTGTLSRTHDSSPVYSSLYDKNNALDSMINTLNSSRNKFSNGGLNINYTHDFDKTKKTLTFDLDYFRYDYGTEQTFLNNTFIPSGSLITSQTLIDTLPAGINIFSAKADYSMPLRNKGKFEAGVKSSYVNTDNAANYFNVINRASTIDYNLTNRFLYKENINAAYLNFNRAFKRFELQTGLRVENTNGNGHQLGNVQKADSSFTNHYTNLFPTAYFSYKLDTAGKHLLVLSYGRRIGRPGYAALNPFITVVDKFTYFAGNPFLKPQFTDNYKLAYSYRNLFTVAFTYNHTTDIFNETIHQNGNIFISTTGNIGERKNIDLSFNTNLRPAPWMSLNLYAEVYNNTYKGQLFSGYLRQSATTLSANANSQFTLGKGWLAELGGFYNSRQAYGQFLINPGGALNAGIQKKAFKNKGTLRLNARDIFHTNTAAGTITNIQNARATFHNFLDSRVIAIGFTYNFGKSINNPAKRNTGGAETEQNRVRN